MASWPASGTGGERFVVPGNLDADTDPEPASTGPSDHSTANPSSDSGWPNGPGIAEGLSQYGEFVQPGTEWAEKSEPVPSGADRGSPGSFSGWPNIGGEELDDYRYAVRGNQSPGSDPEVDGPDGTSY